MKYPVSIYAVDNKDITDMSWCLEFKDKDHASHSYEFFKAVALKDDEKAVTHETYERISFIYKNSAEPNKIFFISRSQGVEEKKMTYEIAFSKVPHLFSVFCQQDFMRDFRKEMETEGLITIYPYEKNIVFNGLIKEETPYISHVNYDESLLKETLKKNSNQSLLIEDILWDSIQNNQLDLNYFFQQTNRREALSSLLNNDVGVIKATFLTLANTIEGCDSINKLPAIKVANEFFMHLNSHGKFSCYKVSTPLLESLKKLLDALHSKKHDLLLTENAVSDSSLPLRTGEQCPFSKILQGQYAKYALEIQESLRVSHLSQFKPVSYVSYKNAQDDEMIALKSNNNNNNNFSF